jgi:hypothetical protein
LLTNISFSVNVEKTAQTTKRGTWNLNLGTFFTFAAREGTSTDFGRVGLSAILPTSLAASVSLLSSVTAFV